MKLGETSEGGGGPVSVYLYKTYNTYIYICIHTFFVAPYPPEPYLAC